MGFFSNLFGGGSNNDVLSTMVNNGAYLVDVRSESEFAQGSVKGAVNIPLDKLTNQLAKFKNKEQVVVFCRSGMRSEQAKSILNQYGITNVTNGGTWQNVAKLLS
ncbi:MAG TPA: rhodanese-like domain-containing protein [Bacteroidia bacterium]|nr:rhodanese-like domain-containing protein [Bacteroidota bacterium]MBL0050659.1 rhodanese-like domain-containing protein [Bacteroidota bacterium]HRC33715.1 rhodanese-like domain-containing protein [Bacteroidia bacterium]